MGRSESSDEDEAPPPRRPHCLGRKAGTTALPPQLQPVVGAPAVDLALETNGRDSIPAFIPEDFALASETLVRYRLSAVAIIRQTDRDTRRTPLSDLRDLERKAFPGILLLAHLFSHIAPNVALPH